MYQSTLTLILILMLIRMLIPAQVDDVVFGHDIDGSEAFGRRKYDGAGKESRDLANSRHWYKRDVGRAQVRV